MSIKSLCCALFQERVIITSIIIIIVFCMFEISLPPGGSVDDQQDE